MFFSCFSRFEILKLDEILFFRWSRKPLFMNNISHKFVISIHQNTNLMVDVVKTSKSYKNLIQLTICDQNNAGCMLQRWPGDPSRDYLGKILLNETDETCRISSKEW